MSLKQEGESSAFLYLPLSINGCGRGPRALPRGLARGLAQGHAHIHLLIWGDKHTHTWQAHF